MIRFYMILTSPPPPPLSDYAILNPPRLCTLYSVHNTHTYLEPVFSDDGGLAPQSFHALKYLNI